MSEAAWWKSLQPELPYELHSSAPERNALWEYLQGRTSSQQAAERIIVIHPEDISAHQERCSTVYLEEDKYDRGNDIVELLINLAIARPKLIPLILDLRDAISKLPNPAALKELGVDIPDWKTWISNSWDEFIKDIYFSNSREQASLSALWAHESTRSDSRGIPMRFGEHDIGFTEIIMALEHDAWNDPRPLRNNTLRLQSYSIEMLNNSIPIATPWFITAGRKIFYYMYGGEYTYPYYGHSNKIQREYGAASILWHGKDNRSRERWDFWKQRLKWIQGSQELAEYTRVCAKEAIDNMEEIESNMN